jgi:hypothetical protein
MPTESQKKEQDKCINNFARYEKKTGKKNGVIAEILQGQSFEKGDGKRYIIDEDNGKIIEIPNDYKRKTIKNIEWVRDLFCKIPVNSVKLKSQGALEYEAWFKKSEAKWLKISDIMKLAPGQKIKVVSLHRNTGDRSMDSNINPRGSAIKPERFFRNMIVDYRHFKDMEGTLYFKNDDNEKEWDFELEVEYKPGFWYPLKDGYIPSKDPQNILNFFLGRKVHWKDLDRNTHIGFRGPMILLENVKKLPLIYYS